MGKKSDDRVPTVNDVARLAGVSRQTVSRVINDKGEISATTRERVLHAIKELGYQPNSLAQSLATRKSMAIGLVVPTIGQPFFAEIARGVEDEANRLGFSVFLCTAADDPERELRAVTRLRGHRVAGLVTFNSHLDDSTLEREIRGVFPVVLINREVPNVRGIVIWPGYVQGGKLATQHLIDIGRRQIGYIGFSHDSNLDSDKFSGYTTALREAGLSLDNRRILRQGPRRFGRPFEALARVGYETLEQMFDHGVGIDAIFASNDLTAIGAMQFASDHGLQIPDDLAMIGFGGSNIARLVTPSLSTVTMPLYEMGTASVQILMHAISGHTDQHHTVETPPQVVMRESTGGFRDALVPLPIVDNNDLSEERPLQTTELIHRRGI